MENKVRYEDDNSLNGAKYLVGKKLKLDKLVEEIDLEKMKNKNLLSELENLQFVLRDIKKKTYHIDLERESSFTKLKAMENSHSWKITRFLREIKNVTSKRKDKYKSQHKTTSKNPIDSKQELKKIRKLKEKLFVLGFEERALNELHDIVKNNYLTKKIRAVAAWELSMWYSNKLNENDAHKCIELLDISLDGVNDTNRTYHAFIIRAECYKILGDIDKSKIEIEQAFKLIGDANLCLAASNFEMAVDDRIKWVNKALQLYNIPNVRLDRTSGQTIYDCLIVDNITSASSFGYQPKVSVIMPVYNAWGVIETSLKSVMNQTWTNLEIIIVDDCSSDKTTEKIEQLVARDLRVKLIRAEFNRGTYTARNIALKSATGEFVTCHDADDWSHPMKLEVQALHLVENKECIANTSQAARATEDLMFYRKGRIGKNIFPNTSSLMFRREEVVEKIGYWDNVRFSADSEFINRLQKTFGKEAVIDLQTGPLSFPRITMNSLTASNSFGLNGPLTGARRFYRDSYIEFQNSSEDLRYDFPQLSRPFAVVEPMKPLRDVNPLKKRVFDIVFVSDFRQSEIVLRLLNDIMESKKQGLKIGIIQMYSYEPEPTTVLDSLIRDLINNGVVEILVHGESISCDYLIVRSTPILQEVQKYIPDVSPKDVHVVIESDICDSLVDIDRCNQNLYKYFGKEGVWHPINPKIRVEIKKYSDRMIPLGKDWTDIKMIINKAIEEDR